VNLFIADDVGLGKTIEAGLIIRELLMRQKVKRVVVGSPASVLLRISRYRPGPGRDHVSVVG
jgi:SNF2 family DNA or RNA helicase